MNHDQGARCAKCGKLLVIDSRGDYLAPAHDHDGALCPGSGRTVRLVSAGMYGGPWTANSNGKARKTT